MSVVQEMLSRQTFFESGNRISETIIFLDDEE